MHELSIVDSLIEQVDREVQAAGHAGRVLSVDLTVGRLSGANADSIRFAFELLAPGTIVAAAKLRIAEPSAVCHCLACGARKEIDDLTARCSQCGSANLTLEGGQELMLTSIELED
jgi:hydrogenase nickel incorporation protein HypA/HybF